MQKIFQYFGDQVRRSRARVHNDKLMLVLESTQVESEHLMGGKFMHGSATLTIMFITIGQ